MSRWTFRVVLAVGVAAVGAGVGAAQPPIPGGPAAVPRPAFSPYLNLSSSGFGDGIGGSPAVNYYGIIRPQVAGRQALLGLERGVMQNRQAISGLQSGTGTEAGPTGIPGTGHPTNFLNTAGYFLNNSGTGRPGAAGGGPGGGAGGAGGAAGANTRPGLSSNAGQVRPGRKR